MKYSFYAKSPLDSGYILLVLSNCFLKLVDNASGPLSLAPIDLAILSISPTMPDSIDY
jgi:hypothetical protein